MYKLVNKEGKKRIMFSGVVASCGRKRGFNGKGAVENRISVKVDALTENDKNEIVNLFEIDTTNQFTPKWLKLDSAKDGFDFVNVHSKFDISIDNKSVIESFDELNVGANIDVILKVKDGAFYPVAIRVMKNGDDYNPFEEF